MLMLSSYVYQCMQIRMPLNNVINAIMSQQIYSIVREFYATTYQIFEMIETTDQIIFDVFLDAPMVIR